MRSKYSIQFGRTCNNAFNSLYLAAAKIVTCTALLIRYLEGDSSDEIVEMLADMLLTVVENAPDDPEEAQEAAEGIIEAMSEPSGCFAQATLVSTP